MDINFYATLPIDGHNCLLHVPHATWLWGMYWSATFKWDKWNLKMHFLSKVSIK